MIPQNKSTVFYSSLFFVGAIALVVSFSLDAAEPATATKTKVANSVSSASEAKTEKEMKPYKQKITQTEVSFEMVPIPGGEFIMGSPDKEKAHKKDE